MMKDGELISALTQNHCNKTVSFRVCPRLFSDLLALAKTPFYLTYNLCFD